MSGAAAALDALFSEVLVGSQVGKGRLGELYKCLNTFGKPMLIERIEILKRDFGGLSERVEGAKKIRHANIVATYGQKRVSRDDDDDNDDDGNSKKVRTDVFFEMVSGGTLQEALAHFGAFDAQAVVLYCQQILQGLEVLHAHDIFMGGLSASDILLAEKGTVKIMGHYALKPTSKQSAFKDMASVGKLAMQMVSAPKPSSPSAASINAVEVPAPKIVAEFADACKTAAKVRDLLEHSFFSSASKRRRSRWVPYHAQRFNQSQAKVSNFGARPRRGILTARNKNPMTPRGAPPMTGRRVMTSRMPGWKPPTPRGAAPRTPRGSLALPSGPSTARKPPPPSARSKPPSDEKPSSDQMTSQPKDATAAAAARHRASVGLSANISRTPAQMTFLSVLDTTSVESVSAAASPGHAGTNLKDDEEKSRANEVDYKKKKLDGLMQMSNRRRLSNMFSALERGGDALNELVIAEMQTTHALNAPMIPRLDLGGLTGMGFGGSGGTSGPTFSVAAGPGISSSSEEESDIEEVTMTDQLEI
eukprot:g3215.t1